ncbi:hypothetical protein CWB99_02990 [Pseudoalteromonas rubra]|uniref:Uncharacterized protein n=1 Tax=Pseudoalteromonas rubra TaxID=43658 RepID=A0A5S3WSS6_9GAMM|nr:hypothetical protein [Pseudoalteromonas rubra]TMP30188.1 hypothetical protein CWC00_17495 [Pseudoalteromonas rubra]TMP31943.1 hypothetical protein CWB99_02990 [Pseudoalteromonas rubra]
MVVYFENNHQAGVQVTYDHPEYGRQYDFFENMYLFNAWLSHEYDCQSIEITDENYPQLVQQGVI